MSYILIWVLSYSSYMTTSGQAEFSSQINCLNAIKEFDQVTKDSFTHRSVICVKK